MKNTNLFKATCPHDCPDACSMEVEIDEVTKKVIKVSGEKSHPVTKGFLCNKVNNYIDLIYNKDRVLYPKIRVNSKQEKQAKWKRISWEEAIDIISRKLDHTLKEYGPNSILPYSYSGTLGLVGFLGLGEAFFNKLGAIKLLRTICTAAGEEAEALTDGRIGNADIENIPKMDLILLWGTNTFSTNVHMVPFLEEARRNGAKIICIDPRVTRTSKFSDIHIQPKPGTDSALALCISKYMFDNNLVDIDFLKKNTIGWEKFLNESIKDFSIEKTSELTGVDKNLIEILAKSYAKTKNSFIRLNWGIQRRLNGGMIVRTIKMLPLLSGAVKGDGGICLSTGGEMRNFNYDGIYRPDLCKNPNRKTVNMIQLGKALASDSEKIKFFYVWNSDPVNCAPNSNLIKKSLLSDEIFTVVHDTFNSDTSNYADILLPADTALERDDFYGAYGNYYYSFSPQVIPKVGESKDNNEVFRMLAKKMNFKESCFSMTNLDMIKHLIEKGNNPFLTGKKFSDFEKNSFIKADLDYKDRFGVKSGLWPTKSGKIEIFSEFLKSRNQSALPIYTEQKLSNKYPLTVLSAATHNFIGASFQHVPRLKKIFSRQTLEISDVDAKKRDINDGDICRVFNNLGETYAYALIVKDLLPGTINVPKQIRSSQLIDESNINSLVSEEVADFGKGPIYYSTFAEVEKRL